MDEKKLNEFVDSLLRKPENKSLVEALSKWATTVPTDEKELKLWQEIWEEEIREKRARENKP